MGTERVRLGIHYQSSSSRANIRPSTFYKLYKTRRSTITIDFPRESCYAQEKMLEIQFWCFSNRFESDRRPSLDANREISTAHFDA